MARTGIRLASCAAAIGCAVLLGACSTTVDGTPAASAAPTATEANSDPVIDPADDGDTDDIAHPKQVDESTSCKSALTPEQAAATTGWQVEESGYSDDEICFYTVTTPGDGFGAVTIRLDSSTSGQETELAGNPAFVAKDQFGCAVAITIAEPGDDYGQPVAVYAQLTAPSQYVTPDEACTQAQKLATTAFDNLPDA
jgi:uncharacterized protein DUF3558